MTAYANGARTESIFDAARRAVAIEDLASKAGVKLMRAGRELRGPCPICGAGSKSKSGPFALRADKQTFRAYCGCDLRGDVVDLERALGGGSPLEAARRLVGGEYRSTPRPVRETRPEPQGPSVSDRVALELWNGAHSSIRGTLAERYLRRRGIAAEVVAMVGERLRFHPRAKWGWDDEARAWVTAPAMLARVETDSGPTGGVHATYLTLEGLKAPLSPAKRMWGPQADAEGRPGGAWLIGPSGEGDLVTGEGIETTLAVVTLGLGKGLPLRACAALSLNRLQGGVERDEEGRIDPFNPKGDPTNPAFTWPAPPDAPWSEVLVAVDRDMSAIRVKGRTARGRTCWFEFGAEQRARMCGRLAVAAWLAAGAPKARAIAPPPGSDFNDELRRVLALGCGA
ncbi:hypothetical protein [Phenylobacterium sp.]|uniref:DUF7146 domain-containing protein n=1 Tax=Phenylobacterium sp. TaxID=1871053 RepID=UPI002736510A|nr:hypothetical protein [Phenylobacterium sp.]MDP3853166.1 hypothetical protein [Phenylobacterium sp.]